MTTPELKPCPFCGGEARIVEGEESAYVQCQQVKMHVAIVYDGDNNAANEVAEQWNRRSVPVASEDVADLIERLKAGCVCIGSDEDNPGVELYDVEGASDTMAEAAEALTAALSGQTAVPMAVSDAAAKLREILAEFDAEVADELSHEGERADLWSEIEVPVELLRSALATPVSPAPDAGREAFDEMEIRAAVDAAISKAQAAGGQK